MNDTHYSTAGIEVQERMLDTWELGFLAGVFAAWGVRAADDGEYRDALGLLMAHRQESSLQDQAMLELGLVPAVRGKLPSGA